MSVSPLWLGAILPAAQAVRKGVDAITSKPFTLHANDSDADSTTGASESTDQSAEVDSNTTSHTARDRLRRLLERIQNFLKQEGLPDESEVTLQTDGADTLKIVDSAGYEQPLQEFLDDHPDIQDSIDDLVPELQSEQQLPLTTWRDQATVDGRRNRLSLFIKTDSVRWQWSA